MNLLKGFIIGVLAQILTFIQLQGQFKFPWMKNNIYLVSLLGFPISILYILSVKYMVLYFEGNMWPSRLLGFSIGAMVFTYMSHLWFQEPFTTKTGICLFLAFLIMMVQLFWK